MPLVSPFRQSFSRERLQNQAVAARDGAGEGLGVHVGDHQHLAGVGIDGDRDDQAVGIEFRGEGRAGLDGFVVAARREAGRGVGHGRGPFAGRDGGRPPSRATFGWTGLPTRCVA